MRARLPDGAAVAEECIDFLVDRVGHERANATAEVPMAFIRLAVTRQKLTPDMDVAWTFYGDLPWK